MTGKPKNLSRKRIAEIKAMDYKDRHDLFNAQEEGFKKLAVLPA